MKPKLKPCPFCGERKHIDTYLKDSSIERNGHLYWHIFCLKCHAEGPPVKDSHDIPNGEETAILLWNARR
jgi:Lar family restriction alleviation protein